MDTIKIFLLEDSDQDAQSFVDACEILEAQSKLKVILTRYKNCEDSLANLDSSYDGAIIDLKINTDSGAGNNVAEQIVINYKIPTVIYTGTPAEGEIDSDKIPTFKKSVTTCEEIILYFHSIYKTGITKVFGDRGHINARMIELFWNIFMPNIKTWESHSCSDEEKHISLLRIALSHLHELMEKESEFVLGEEMYIQDAKVVKTGSVTTCKDNKQYIVVTPACDLEIRKDGVPKTTHVLLCKIEKSEDIFTKEKGNKTSEKDIKNIFEKICSNTKSPYFHWLPKIKGFEGGVINFRHLVSIEWSEFLKSHKVIIQISQPFIKDIISRFSVYYARQGQPDFSKEYYVERLYGEYGPKPEDTKGSPK